MTDPLFIGISFGTLNSTIALIGKGEKEGKGEIICNEDGDRNIPSYVVFTGHEVLVGTQAKVQSGSNSKGAIVEFRNLLGKKFADREVQEQQKRLPMNIIDSGKGPVYQVPKVDENADEVGTEEHSVVEVTTRYLKKLKETAENFMSKTVDGLVISVATHFGEEQRKELIAAAKDAGFNIIHTIHEPVAAAMAFDKSPSAPTSKKLDENLVVLDLGGHQFNVTCLSSHKGLYTVLSSVDDTHLGGTHFDEVLVNHFKQEFYRKTKMDISESRRSLIKLFSACEKTKRSLTRQDMAPCSVESLYDGMDLHSTVNRNRFEMLAEPLFNRCVSTVHSALKEANLKPEDIDQVLFVGGSARMPRFHAKMKTLFSNGPKETLFRSDVEPDEVVAIGCAVQAGLISTWEGDYAKDSLNIKAEALSKSIGIATASGAFVTILPERTPLPVHRSVTVQGSTPDQVEMFFAIYEGESAAAKENTLLAEVLLSELPPQKPVTLSFTMEMDGVLQVHAVEKTSGSHIKVKLSHK